MQSAASSTSTQSDLLKTMQQQSAQNMYVSSSGTNSASNVRGNHQAATGLFRGPPASSQAPRNNGRHIPIQMYQQTIPPVVVPFAQYPARQTTYPGPQFTFTQPIQPSFYPYQFYQTPQRGAVGINTGVGVGNAMSVQTGPNGPMAGPPGATQTQISLPNGAVIASGVPTGTGTVLGVATSASAQQVGAPPMVGIVPTAAVPTQQTLQPQKRARTHALKIIDPSTNKDILEDFDLAKNSSNTEAEYMEQIPTTAPPSIQTDISAQEHAGMAMGGNSIIVMSSDTRPNMSCNPDIHQMPQQRDINVGQTPVVSAMSDAPSVEIPPTSMPQKPRAKKIIPIVSPKDDQNVSQPSSTDISTKQQQQEQKPQQQQQQSQKSSNGVDKTNLRTECVQQQQQSQQQQAPPQQQYQKIQVPQYQQAAPSIHQAAAPSSLAAAAATTTTTTTTTTIDRGVSNVNEGTVEAVTDFTGGNITNSASSATSTTVDGTILNNSITQQLVDPPTSSVSSSNNVQHKHTQQHQHQQQQQQQQQQPQREQQSDQVVNNNNISCVTGTTGANALAATSVHNTMQLTEKEANDNLAKSNATTKPECSLTTAESATQANGIAAKVKATENSNGTEIPHSTYEDKLDKDIINDDTCNNSVTVSSSTTMAECDETDRAVHPVSQMHIQCEMNFDSNDNGMDAVKNAANNNVVDHVVAAPASTVDISPADEKSQFNEVNGATSSNITTATSDDIAADLVPDSNLLKTEQQQPSLISYNEGQWSPHNPTGKRQYDREQLLQLREAKASRIQPELKNISILPQPNLMMPSFASRNNHKRVQSMVGSIGASRGSAADNSNLGPNFNKQASMSGVHSRGSMNSKGGMIHVNLSLNQDVKLNENDNAWRPRVLVRGSDDSDSNDKTQREKDDLIRRVRGILNKLTPEKFDTLVEEIIKLKIDTPDKMEDVLVLVFEKAIDEPNFSVSYARLCHRLINEVKARDEKMESGTKTNLAHFRNALLDKTEREFTDNVTQSSAKEMKLQPIVDKIKKCADPSEKAELEALLEEEERKIRRRSGGTVRFIGELFKISMLTGKIICSCIETLLNPNSEDMLECLCKLLTTVGAKFEQTQYTSKDSVRYYSLESHISRMQGIASKTDKDGQKVSSRVRFMLQDVIDLRKNKWQSTRNEAPKTMEQIQKEAKTEQLSSQYLNYSSGGGASMSGVGGGSGANGSSMGGGNAKRGGDDRGGNRYNDSRSGSYGGSHSQRGDSGSLRRQQQGGGSNAGGGHSNNNDDNTWHVQTGKGGRSLAVDSNKLEGLLNLNTDTKKMGSSSQFIWNNAAARPPSTPSNPFAALSLSDNKSSDRDNDRDRSSGPRNKGSYNKGSMERDRYGDRGIHSRTGSSQASRENSSSRGSQGVRGMMNSSSMQKSASHSKYMQQMPSPRVAGKSSGMSPMIQSSLYPSQRSEQTNNNNSVHYAASSTRNSPPNATFEKSSESDSRIIKSVVSDLIEIATHEKSSNTAVESCFSKIKDSQRCDFLLYILSHYLHVAGPVQRRQLANVVVYLIQKNFLSVEHFKMSYEQFCELSSDMIIDIPELWLYVFQFCGPLIAKGIINLSDLWIKQLKEESPNIGPKFLKTFLLYCQREIGPNFTRNMWKKANMKWSDFVPENEVKNFIESNKLEYIENDKLKPEIECKEQKDKLLKRVMEHIDHLLKEGSSADIIIDYINGNIVDVDKLFIRNLTEKLCSFAITFKDSFKLEVDTFGKVCLPVLQRYLDSKVDRELECLYSMQLLVHRLEHPRGVLNDLFVELEMSEIIPQDSFIKWRDANDQSAGKGVAVKGLNQFFNQLLSGETSDD